MGKWKKAILDFLGLNNDDVPTEEQLASGIEKAVLERQELKTKAEGLEQEKADLEAKVEELEKLKPAAEVGDQYLKDTREKAESDYKLLKKEEGAEPDEEMLGLIRKADINQVKVYAKNFAAEVQKKIPAICENCGKPTTASRRSSKETLDDKEKRKARSSYQQG